MTTIHVKYGCYEFKLQNTDSSEVSDESVFFKDEVLEVPQGSSPESFLRALARERLEGESHIFPKGPWVISGKANCPELDYLTAEALEELRSDAEQYLRNIRRYGVSEDG